MSAKSRGPIEATAAMLEYWNAQLLRYNLGMDRGASDSLVYGHPVLLLDFDVRIGYRPRETKQRTTGERLEEEWPQSLC